MKMLILSPPAIPEGKQLRSMIRSMDIAQNEEQNIEQTTEFYTSIDSLMARLKHPINDKTITVLFPSDEDELTRLITIRPLLRNARVILILPNSSDTMISTGHRLRPRFLSYADSNFKEITAVMAKMLSHDQIAEDHRL